MNTTELDADQLHTMVFEMKGDLHPDLEQWVVDGPFGKMLNAPLVQELFLVPGMAGRVNKSYEAKKGYRDASFDEGNWHRYVFIHERPYRAEMLQRLIDDETLTLDDRATWELISDVWTDSENVQQYDGFWSTIWVHKNTRLAMSAHERQKFDALPDLIPVWHGLERNDSKTLGFSWTSSKRVGTWFARRFATLKKRGAYLAEGRVPKSKVKAYLLGRNEFEIIAFPDDVQVTNITRVKRD